MDIINLIKPIAGYTGGAVVVFGLIVYLWAILRGKVRSNKFTWGVWIVVTGMLCVSYYQSVGLANTIWVSAAYFIGTVLVFIFLNIYSVKGDWTWVEKTCLIAVIPIIFLWIFFHSSILALTLTMLVDILGAIPLIRTVYADPTSEYGPAWYLGFAANAINLVAVEHWDYANAAYPLYLALLTFSVAILIYLPRFLRSRPEPEGVL